MFLGFVELGDTLNFCLQVRSGDLPVNADALPNFRVYADTGLLESGGGTGTFRETGTITGATNANPIVVASVGHGLTTGMRVNNTGVGGNTNANTTAAITRVDADHFSLDGVAGNSAYTAGGTWRVAGLYNLAVIATAGNGFAAGENYSLVATYEIGGVPYSQVFALGVV